MEQIPDAPWIRQAELYGVPDDDPVECPICGNDCDTIYLDKSGVVCGCENCMTKQDAWDWREEEKERGRPDWLE